MLYASTMQKTIDLNADLGESFGPWVMGDDLAMMDIVNSANIACGGHAGDPQTMFDTLTLAKKHGVSVGAHPGFNDKEGFGRRRLPLSATEVEQLIASQVGALVGVAGLVGVKVNYVKAHGALSNWAAEDATTAVAIARAVKKAAPGCALLAVAGTELEKAGRSENIKTYSEIFADRAYADDGNLVSRAKAGAMITDPKQASERLIQFFETGLMPTLSGKQIPLPADSICIHGDSAHAVHMAREVKSALSQAGITLAPFIAA